MFVNRNKNDVNNNRLSSVACFPVPILDRYNFFKNKLRISNTILKNHFTDQDRHLDLNLRQTLDL